MDENPVNPNGENNNLGMNGAADGDLQIVGAGEGSVVGAGEGSAAGGLNAGADTAVAAAAAGQAVEMATSELMSSNAGVDVAGTTGGTVGAEAGMGATGATSFVASSATGMGGDALQASGVGMASSAAGAANGLVGAEVQAPAGAGAMAEPANGGFATPFMTASATAAPQYGSTQPIVSKSHRGRKAVLAVFLSIFLILVLGAGSVFAWYKIIYSKPETVALDAIRQFLSGENIATGGSFDYVYGPAENVTNSGRPTTNCYDDYSDIDYGWYEDNCYSDFDIYDSKDHYRLEFNTASSTLPYTNTLKVITEEIDRSGEAKKHVEYNVGSALMKDGVLYLRANGLKDSMVSALRSELDGKESPSNYLPSNLRPGTKAEDLSDEDLLKLVEMDEDAKLALDAVNIIGDQWWSVSIPDLVDEYTGMIQEQVSSETDVQSLLKPLAGTYKCLIDHLAKDHAAEFLEMYERHEFIIFEAYNPEADSELEKIADDFLNKAHNTTYTVSVDFAKLAEFLNTIKTSDFAEEIYTCVNGYIKEAIEEHQKFIEKAQEDGCIDRDDYYDLYDVAYEICRQSMSTSEYWGISFYNCVEQQMASFKRCPEPYYASPESLYISSEKIPDITEEMLTKNLPDEWRVALRVDNFSHKLTGIYTQTLHIQKSTYGGETVATGRTTRTTGRMNFKYEPNTVTAPENSKPVSVAINQLLMLLKTYYEDSSSGSILDDLDFVNGDGGEEEEDESGGGSEDEGSGEGDTGDRWQIYGEDSYDGTDDEQVGRRMKSVGDSDTDPV